MTKQYGIIYKFTIVTKLKMDGQRPFYIGQHITTSIPEEFLSRNHPYYGSGSIWGDFLEKLRELNPNNWRCFIKREILFSSDKVTQRGLDAMEAYYIKREKSHYSFGIGGCNVLWGTANQFGSGSPMKDPNVRLMRSEYMKEYYKVHKHPSSGRKWSENERKRQSEAHKGNKHSIETIEKIRNKNKGRKRTSEFCQKMKEIWQKRKESGWVSPIKGNKVSDEIKQKRADGVRNYYKNNPSSMKGRKHTTESIRKISLGHKGLRAGVKTSEETKRKMSESAKIAWIKRKQSL